MNSKTTLKKEKLNKKVNKTIITRAEEHKMAKGKIDIKTVKIEAEAEALVKKEQITKGLQKKMHKMIRTKNDLHRRNHDINAATRKISINLENSIVLRNNKKTKQPLMWS